MNDSPVDCQSRGKALPAGKEVLLPLPTKNALLSTDKCSVFVYPSLRRDWDAITSLTYRECYDIILVEVIYYVIAKL